MKKKLIIFGTGPFAQIAYWYFREDSDYEVVAFSVNKDYIKDDEIIGLPVVPYESLAKDYSFKEFELFIAIGYGNQNSIRAKIYRDAKKKEYKFATYVYSGVKTWPNNKIGENTFIFEDNTIQPYVKIGNNVTLWSGNHIGHHSKIGDLCFITSHVVVSGFVQIGERSFVGVNSTFRDAIKIGVGNIIGAGALILKDTKDYEVYPGVRTKPIEKDSRDITI